VTLSWPVVAVALLAVASGPVQADLPAPPARTLSADAARADVQLMRRALETVHPGLHRRTSKPELDRAFSELEDSLTAPVSDVELYRRISAVLALIRCSHTKADQTQAIEAWRRDQPSHLPFRFRLVEGRMLVVSSDPTQTQLLRGAEVLAIDGRPVAELIAALGVYVSIDGFTEPSRLATLASDSDLMGASFDHFYPYAFGFPSQIEVTLRDTDTGAARTVPMRPMTFRSWLQLDNDGLTHRRDFADAVTWRMVSSDVGYLRIDTFVNYRKPVSAAAVYTRALDELRKKGARALIVDLRANGGGSNDAALELLDALASAPYTYQRAVRYRAVRYGDLPDHISSWGDRDALFNPPLDRFDAAPGGQFDLKPQLAPDVLQPRQPSSTAFAGEVIVLTGPANASGATMVVAKLRDMGRARLIGEPSGGSADGPTAGTIFNVKLPNSGISVRVPVAFNAMNVRSFDPNGGVRPDVLVVESVADFRARDDRVMRRAISELQASPRAVSGNADQGLSALPGGVRH
jgi:hypothetical protein